MREEHPIDKRFKALQDAEAAPPEAVREALAAHMGWNAGASPGTAWRPLLWAASALVVIGMGIGVWMNTETSSAEQVAENPAAGASQTASGRSADAAQETSPVERTNNGIDADGTSVETVTTAVPAQGTSPVDHTRSTAVPHQPATSSSGVSSETASTPKVERTAEGHVGSRSSATSVIKQGSSRASMAVVPPSGSTLLDPITIDPLVEDPFANGPSIASAETAPFMDDQRPLRLASIPQPRIDMAAGTPLSRAVRDDYVLPHGCWWIGAYAGIGTVNGEWRGADASALSDAETWRSTAQGGLLLGRGWHNGWSASGGVGVARVRSTFRHEKPGALEAFTNVDTMWVENSMMDIPIYTWTIDSLVEMRPGASLRSDARNYYTAIQVPLNVAWHGDLRRLRYGAFGGVTAWVPTQRKGLTLVQTDTDAGFTASNLADASVNERFGTQIHGQLGLSIGYSITEFFSAYAEPMISAPLVSFGGNDTPWLTRPLLQIRLQHALCSRSR